MISHAAWNAVLNGTSAVLLGAGFVMIRSHRVQAHKLCMLAATGTSTVFLISYIAYHLRVGDVHFQGIGRVRTVYFAILGTHTVLAAVIVPMVIITLARAWRLKFASHKRIARWTLPIWAYVSITGVVVYFMLYQIYAAPAPHP